MMGNGFGDGVWVGVMLVFFSFDFYDFVFDDDKLLF